MKNDETRRLSASSVLTTDNSRRNSSGTFSYETECSGCYPENQITNLTSLSPQINKKINEGRNFRSCSLSSTSDNNSSISLTPTENSNDFYSTINELSIDSKKNNLSQNIYDKSSDDFINTDNCNDTVAENNSNNEISKNIDISADFSLEGDLSIPQTNQDSYQTNYNLFKVLHDSSSICITNNIEKIYVPNENSSKVDNSSSSCNSIADTFSENFLSNDITNNEKVPNESVDKKFICSKLSDIHSGSLNNNIDSNNSPIDEITNKIDEYYIGEESKSDKLPQKIATNTQYSFIRPDGIIYIDSLVLQENPHLLSNSDSNNFYNLKSSQNIENKDFSQKELVKKRNKDNLKVDDMKKLPLRSFEENFAPSWMSSPELLALKHNLTFPESVTASPVVRRTQRCCRKFCVDLSKYNIFLSSLSSFFH